MGYSPWGHRESEMTEQLILTEGDYISQVVQKSPSLQLYSQHPFGVSIHLRHFSF